MLDLQGEEGRFLSVWDCSACPPDKSVPPFFSLFVNLYLGDFL